MNSAPRAMAVAALAIAGASQAPPAGEARSLEVIPWGGVPIVGTAVRATPCGITVRVADRPANLELPWSEVRSVRPADPAWEKWIEAGDASRRGAERLARGDAALAVVAYARAVERLEGADGACVVHAWRGWAHALEASGQGVAAMVARLKAEDLAARNAPDGSTQAGLAADGNEGGWPVDLCPACATATAASDARAAIDASPLEDARVQYWSAVIREVLGRQAGEAPRPLPKAPRLSGAEDPNKRERRILDAWIEALGDGDGARARARADLSQLLGRTEGPLRHWCRVAIGESLMRDVQSLAPGSPAARDGALDAAEQFLTIVACDDSQVPMLSATAAELGAQALELAGDQRGAATIRRELLRVGAVPTPAATEAAQATQPGQSSQSSQSSRSSRSSQSSQEGHAP